MQIFKPKEKKCWPGWVEGKENYWNYLQLVFVQDPETFGCKLRDLGLRSRDVLSMPIKDWHDCYVHGRNQKGSMVKYIMYFDEPQNRWV